MAGPTTVSVPAELSFPAGGNSLDSSLTVSSGTVASLTIGGVFTITLKSQSGTSVSFTLGLKPGTTRPGSSSTPISVVVGGTTVVSTPISIDF